MLLTAEECRAVAGALKSVRPVWTMQEVVLIMMAVARLLGRLPGLAGAEEDMIT